MNGSIASSALTVNAGGTIGGTGIIGNTTINGGTLSPGNSIGTLTVQGNLVMASAAAYIVEVSPTAADRTNVTRHREPRRHRAGGVRAGSLHLAHLHHPVGDGRTAPARSAA